MKTPADQEIDARQIVFSPLDPAIVFAATDGDGVLLSRNGGSTWLPYNRGLTNLFDRALAIDSDGIGLHVGTDGGGVFDLSFTPGSARNLAPVGHEPPGTPVVVSGRH